MEADPLNDNASHLLDPTLNRVLLDEARSTGGPDDRRVAYRANRDRVALGATSIPHVADHVINDDSGLWVRE